MVSGLLLIAKILDWVVQAIFLELVPLGLLCNSFDVSKLFDGCLKDEHGPFFTNIYYIWPGFFFKEIMNLIIKS